MSDPVLISLIAAGASLAAAALGVLNTVLTQRTKGEVVELKAHTSAIKEVLVKVAGVNLK